MSIGDAYENFIELQKDDFWMSDNFAGSSFIPIVWSRSVYSTGNQLFPLSSKCPETKGATL
jgi:hypothetical protein